MPRSGPFVQLTPQRTPPSHRLQCRDFVLQPGDEVDEAIGTNLQVMDATALALCRDQKLPINVFSIFKSGALKSVVLGEDEGTMVHC